jgi:hypothetical protein
LFRAQCAKMKKKSKVKKSKRLLFSLIILAIVIIIILPLLIFNKNKNFEFSAGECNNSLAAHDKAQQGIREINWLNDTTIQINAVVSINCANKIKGGDYNQDGNDLALKYKTSWSYFMASCMCAHELNYKISNIERKDYNITINQD